MSSAKSIGNNHLSQSVRFDQLSLSPRLLRGISQAKFEICTPIQARSLPHSLNGKDVIGQAQTGTGKTAAFLVTVIEDLLRNPVTDEHYLGEARALILAPTRELAIQIGHDARTLSRFTDLSIHVLVGGIDPEKQLSMLRKKPCDILIGTPGRLLDFSKNSNIHLDRLEILVVDEADRMLDMGFREDVEKIISNCPNKRQTLLFSATDT